MGQNVYAQGYRSGLLIVLYSLYLKTTAKVRVDEHNLKGDPNSKVVPKPIWVLPGFLNGGAWPRGFRMLFPRFLSSHSVRGVLSSVALNNLVGCN